ncbi:unnamed protein product, partial [Rotaria socialis]
MGTEFCVKGDPLAQSNSSCIVHLIEIDDNNDQPLASAMNQMLIAHRGQPLCGLVSSITVGLALGGT